MRLRRYAVVLLSVVACRDVTLPPAPAPGAKGEVFGRVVRAVAGSADPQPAAGASVTLQSSSLGTLAGADGHFKIDGISSTTGVLLFQLDSDGDGTYDLQRSVRLEDVGAGPERAVDLGDVSVSQNARLHGRVIRGDLTSAGGHVGILVFVPQSSFSTYSGDDGRYALAQLPAGTLDLAFFRTGYLPAAVSGLSLRPAEDFAVDDVVLTYDDGGSAAGSIGGSVSTAPAGPITGATATAIAVGTGAKFNGTVGADGALTVGALQAGLYDLQVTDPGFTSVLVPNVPVYPGQQTQVQVVLGAGGLEGDGGVRPPTPDGGISCTGNGDCGTLQWCDDGFCRPQCGSSAQCNNGRVCDLGTRTCVVPCSASCAAGEACDPVSESCRPVCDGSRPCASGFQCGPNSVCIPQCQVRADCGGAHQTCQAGACVSDGTCDTDLDCARADLCIALTCQPRQTALSNEGYACGQPCDCRLDESCDGTSCILSPIPSVVLDGGADLAAALAAAGPGTLVGLRAGDSFQVAGTITLTHSGQALTGGYVRCGPARDVYDRNSSSAVFIDAGVGFSVAGTILAPVSDVALRSLELHSAGSSTDCPLATVNATHAPNLSGVYLSGEPAFPASTSCATPASFVACSDCGGLYLDTVNVGVMPTNLDWRAIALAGGNGAFNAISAAASQSSAPNTSEVIHVEQLDGPLEISGVDVGFTASSAQKDWGLIDVSECAGNPISIHDGQLVFPVQQVGGLGAAVHVVDCTATDIERLVIDGSQNPFSMTGGHSFGIWAINSGGTIGGSTITFPTGNPADSTDVAGIYLHGPLGAFAVDGNTIEGGSGLASIEGIWVEQITQGPLTLTQDVADGGDALQEAWGLYVYQVPPTAGLSVTKSTFRSATSGNSFGLQLNAAGARIEQTQMIAVGSTVHGLQVSGGSSAELYSSYVLGQGTISYGLFVDGSSSIRAAGNSIESSANNTAVTCNTPNATFTSNLIGAGSTGPTENELLDDGTGACLAPSSWSHNYFWYGGFVGTFGAEKVHSVALEDAGVPDVNGNIYGALAGCKPYDAANPTYVIPSGTPCHDRGVQGMRNDGTLVPFDIDGNLRVLGAAADIGAYERD